MLPVGPLDSSFAKTLTPLTPTSMGINGVGAILIFGLPEKPTNDTNLE